MLVFLLDFFSQRQVFLKTKNKSSFGQITKCMILRHRDGRSTGLCHIDYHDEAAGVEAFNDYNGMPLDGREMNIMLLK